MKPSSWKMTPVLICWLPGVDSRCWFLYVLFIIDFFDQFQHVSTYSLGGQRHPAPLSPKESIHCFQFFSHGGLLLAGAAPWHCYAATHCYADHVDIFWHRQLHNINFPWFNLLVTLSPRRIISMYHTAQYTNCLSLQSNTSCKGEYDEICRCHHSIYPLVIKCGNWTSTINGDFPMVF